MSLPSVVISVETDTLSDVERALEQKMGIVFENHSAQLGSCFGLIVSDVAEAMSYAADFLSANDLDDPNPAWNHLNSHDFKVSVIIRCDREHIGRNFLEAFGEEAATAVSKVLGVTTVYAIENGDVPFGVYRHGQKEEDFADHYRCVFQNRPWIPSEVANKKTVITCPKECSG